MQTIVVGGGHAGFTAARRLERRLRADEARTVLADTRPYMTYQPFLPEMIAGSIEARHVAFSYRAHLRRTTPLSGSATRIDHARKAVTVRPARGIASTRFEDRLRLPH